MKIAIRTDSSIEIGTGHIFRCLALAEKLRTLQAQVEFLCLDLPGNVAQFAKVRGFTVHFLKSLSTSDTINFLSTYSHFDGLIIDHYDLDASYEGPLIPFVKKLLVIDDLANRPHICHLLTDPNLTSGTKNPYKQLVPAGCKFLLGPSYALLRSEFGIFRRKYEKLRLINKEIRHILIFFGGIDLTNETEKALNAIDKLKFASLNIDVVLGSQNPRLSEIQNRLKNKEGYRCLVQIENMAELMITAQLAIGAGGTNSWERLSLGLPSLVVSVANNQTQSCIDLGKEGYHFYLGEHQNVSIDLIAKSLTELIDQPNLTRLCGLKGMTLIDGQGCNYVARALTDEIKG
jgi:UDP-2,4-diacetamido-2,4,6-trideoxy-beta-L-altropyranose hydrolase